MQRHCRRPGAPTNGLVCGLGRVFSVNRDLVIEGSRRRQRGGACFKHLKMGIYDRPGVGLGLKVWLLKPEEIETVLLYWCTTSSSIPEKLRQVTAGASLGTPPMPRLAEAGAQISQSIFRPRASRGSLRARERREDGGWCWRVSLRARERSACREG